MNFAVVGGGRQFSTRHPRHMDAGTNLLRSLVEHPALSRQRLRPVHKVIDLLPAFQHGFDCLVLWKPALTAKAGRHVNMSGVPR
jgi:hypothetical protein